MDSRASTPDPNGFRRQLEGPVRTLSLTLTAAALVIGTVAIGTSASNSVAGRISEIGLRRALGSRPQHVLGQLLVESSTVGLIGGAVGAVTGAMVVLVTAVSHHWTPVLDLRAALAACLAGGVCGAVAGLAPAVRAARLAPVNTLRR